MIFLLETCNVMLSNYARKTFSKSHKFTEKTAVYSDEIITLYCA